MLELPFFHDFIKNTLQRQAVADSVDHLNYFVSACLLGLFALATSTKMLFGSPMHCWVPDEFKESWQKYADNYCFIANSYYTPLDQDLPGYGEQRKDSVSYYRWVPWLFAIQCLCFYLPNYLWNKLHKKTAINPEAFLKEAEKVNGLAGKPREEEITNMAKYFMETVSTFGTIDTKRKLYLNPRSGRNAMKLYLLIKILYLFNIWAQVVVLSKFLGENYFSWGHQSFMNIIRGVEWQESSVFPRVIMCDFQIRHLANLVPHTVQCVMMMNMINEKLYLFLYFWFILLAVATALNFCYYLAILLHPQFRISSIVFRIDNYRASVDTIRHRNQVIARFVDECLHPDGVLLLQFLSEHVGGRVAYDLTNKLITMYLAQERDDHSSCSDSMTKSFMPDCPDGTFMMTALAPIKDTADAIECNP